MACTDNGAARLAKRGSRRHVTQTGGVQPKYPHAAGRRSGARQPKVHPRDDFVACAEEEMV